MQPQTCSVPPFEQPGDATHATLSRRARHRCAGNSRRGRPIAIGDGAPLHQQSSALTKETRAIFLVHGSTATAFPDASSTVCMFPHTQLRNCLLCEWFIHNPDFWRVRCWPSFLPTIACHPLPNPHRFRTRPSAWASSWMTFFNLELASFELAQIGSADSGGSMHTAIKERTILSSVPNRRCVAF